MQAEQALRGCRTLLSGLAQFLGAHRRRAALGTTGPRAALERSHDLLLAWLSPAQRLEFERTGGFSVRGQSGRRYRIEFGTVANIEVFGERGELLYRFAPSRPTCRRRQ